MTIADELNDKALKASRLGRKLEKQMVALGRLVPVLSGGACSECGHETNTDKLRDDPAYQKLTLRGQQLVAPGDCCPDEYVRVCPECGAEESFGE